LDKGSAASLADALERMMKQMRKNPINVISPTREQPKEKPKEEPKKEDKEKPGKGERKTDRGRRDRTGDAAAVEQVSFKVPARRTVEVVRTRRGDDEKKDDEEPPKKRELPGSADKPVTITAFGN